MRVIINTSITRLEEFVNFTFTNAKITTPLAQKILTNYCVKQGTLNL